MALSISARSAPNTRVACCSFSLSMVAAGLRLSVIQGPGLIAARAGGCRCGAACCAAHAVFERAQGANDFAETAAVVRFLRQRTGNACGADATHLFKRSCKRCRVRPVQRRALAMKPGNKTLPCRLQQRRPAVTAAHLVAHDVPKFRP